MIITNCKTVEERKVVLDGINKYNDNQTDRILDEVHQPVELIVKNESNKIIAGLLGYVNYYAGFKINILWVCEDCRGKDIGSKLLKEAENKAKQKGATIAILDTFSFQAEDFYIKNGYTVFGRIEDYPKKNQEFVFLKKKLLNFSPITRAR